MSLKLFAWWKPVEAHFDNAFGKDISTRAARRRANLHLLIIDHGIFRTFWSNLDEIAPGAWRSNQPSQRRLKRYRAMGIKTILNLRGVTDRSPYLFEEEACRDLGLHIINKKLSARKLPRKTRLLELLDAFDTIEKPFLMHCKSGADRAGLASALYLLHIDEVPVEQAQRQLSLRYIHIRASKTGVLDFFLDAYASDVASKPMPIRRWIEKRYNRRRFQKAYRSGKLPASRQLPG